MNHSSNLLQCSNTNLNGLNTTQNKQEVQYKLEYIMFTKIYFNNDTK